MTPQCLLEKKKSLDDIQMEGYDPNIAYFSRGTIYYYSQILH